MKKGIAFVSLLFLVVFIITFAIKNYQSIVVSYYFDLSWAAPLFVILFIAFGAGLVCGYLFAIKSVLLTKKDLWQARRKADRNQSINAELDHSTAKDAI